ncbi:hypothetical protein BLA60_04765 [Actinophytocola xinjiangensis]|uniref:Luciferase-like domain-containing protein n=1 Tax=Actinophytocola xinjiangensis TaxID=485602 RepID=A0A7Z0WSB9_9PSEU|nr:LLM class flavin-dependent oxidoreductase [Actinophytocola xinjiangensis]OLF14433.1 hypothetical protein BLA60_04765 [Actinophytocola xinjiangensis]
MTERPRYLTAVPRVGDPRVATRVARDVIGWSDEFDLDGILLFTGAGAVLDPWLGAAAIVAGTRRLVPLVALNPLYTHPYAAARSLLSITELYGRRVDLNLITGAAISELTSVGDPLDHGDRYARLQEYVELFLALLDGRPVTRAGRFYRVSGLHLSPPLPTELRPRLYLAGRSADAARTATALGATPMGMIPPGRDEVPDGVGALHFGVLARDTAQEAERAAREIFPDDPAGREMLRMSLANTDSVWKHELARAPGTTGSPVRLTPFHSFQADCPYLVGDHDTVAGHIASLTAAGVHTMVMDAPGTKEDFGHLAEVVRRLRAGDAR